MTQRNSKAKRSGRAVGPAADRSQFYGLIDIALVLLATFVVYLPSLQGTTLHQDEDANKAVYGKPLGSDEILGGKVTAPAAAKPLNSILTKYSPKGI